MRSFSVASHRLLSQQSSVALCSRVHVSTADAAAPTKPPRVLSSTDNWRSVCVPNFEKWLATSGIRLEEQGVALALDATGARGLVATKPFREGVTVLSVPMSRFAMSASSLLENSATIQQRLTVLPTFDDVRKEMTVFSVRDPVLHQQMYLAVLLAAERYEAAMTAASSTSAQLFGAYFDVLPHPAVNDTGVIALHKDVLDPMQLMEWDDHQRVFLTVCRHLHEIWVSRSSASQNKSSTSPVPPVEVLYWAFRTVLSRMHLLPDRGLSAPSSTVTATNRKLTLNYESYAALKAVAEQESFIRRSAKKLKNLFSTRTDSEVGLGSSEFRLVPTLVPLIDMCGHVSSSNVSVEVQPRPEVGSCVELQAVSGIAKGETIGLTLNRSQSIAFTLYRFGFLPV
jgi:hypothetical protein